MHYLALFLQDQPSTNQMMGIFAAVAGFYAIFYLFMVAAFMVPSWFIAKKAGFSPWLALLCIFPLTGLVFFYIVAFAEWKVVPAPQQGWSTQPPYPPYPPTPPQS